MEWIDFIHWQECKAIERPGYISEVVNADDQHILTTCIAPLKVPSGWVTSPVKFRIVPEQRPRHSTPLPPLVTGKSVS